MTRQAVHDFYNGIWFWLRGWRYLLGHRRLFAAAMMPVLISTGAAAGLVWLLWTHLPAWVQILVGWMGLHPGWMQHILYYPILISGALLALFASVYTMYLAQSLIAVPFYSYLSDRTLGQLGKKPDYTPTWKEWISHSLRILKVSVIKFVVLLAVGMVLFVFSFVPVFNIFTLTAALMLVALDCMDYSLDALGFGVRARIAYYSSNLAQWLGMAVGLGLTLVIPGLTLLIIPGAVVGAALIVKSERL